MKKSHYDAAVMNICLKNAASLALFVVLAAFFHKWWIVLIAILFQTDVPHPVNVIDPRPDSQFITCGFCGEMLLVKDIEHAVHNEMHDKGWERIPCPHGWINACPHCQEEHADEIENLISSS